LCSLKDELRRKLPLISMPDRWPRQATKIWKSSFAWEHLKEITNCSTVGQNDFYNKLHCNKRAKAAMERDGHRGRKRERERRRKTGASGTHCLCVCVCERKEMTGEGG